MRFPREIISGTVVIFGGSFDPVTYSHIQLATEVLNFELADQVWIVPCGMRPDKPTNLQPYQRLELVSIALDDMTPSNSPIFVDSTEVDAGRYIPTRELMNIYRLKYPSVTFKILIGNDLLGGLHRWDDFYELISENQFLVYSREGANSLGSVNSQTITLNDQLCTKINVQLLSNDVGFSPVLSNVSSTEIRKRIHLKGIRAIIGLTPLPVIEYIEKHKLYI